jgi:hypothetical protein
LPLADVLFTVRRLVGDPRISRGWSFFRFNYAEAFTCATKRCNSADGLSFRQIR